MTGIRYEIREIEEHAKKIAPENKAAQIAYIGIAQSLTKDEHCITVLALVKNRIIRSAK